MIRKKRNVKGSWEYHAEEGWYIGPSLKHYRCFKCFVPRTRQEIIIDTVEIIEGNIPLPITSIDEYLKQSFDDISSVLSRPQKSTLPFFKYGDDTKNAFVNCKACFFKVRFLPFSYGTEKR